MQAELYNHGFWTPILPIISSKMMWVRKALLQSLGREFPHLSVSELREGGDEERSLYLDVSLSGQFVAGIDFTLLDGAVSGSEGFEDTVAVEMSVVNQNCLPIHQEIPENFTHTLFTDELSVVKNRVLFLDYERMAQVLEQEVRGIAQQFSRD